MNDIVQRLRDAAALPTGLYAEAANEIERLCELLQTAEDVYHNARTKIVDMQNALGYDWDLLKATQESLREHQKMINEFRGGWLAAINDALATRHLGCADADDTFDAAKAWLDKLIEWDVAVTTDPAVNGGSQLVPVEPTDEMLRAAVRATHVLNTHRAAEIYKAMIAAAPKFGTSHDKP